MTEDISREDLDGFLTSSRLNVKTIAVFVEKKPFFGAIIVHIPFLHALRRLYPGVRIIVLSPAPSMALLAESGAADDFILYDWSFLGMVRTLRRLAPELVFVLRPASRGLDLAVAASRVPESVSFYSRLGRLLYSRVEPQNSGIYRARKYLTLIMKKGAAGAAPLDSWFRAAAQRGKRSAGAPGRALAVLPGGGGGDFKRWGEGRYFELCGKLSAQDPELRFTWVLGPQEAGLEEKITRSGLAAKSQVLMNAGLPDLAAAAFASAGAVGNDCGPGHLFQMCGCPFTCVISDHDGRGARCADEWLDAPNRGFAAFPRPGAHISSVKVETVLELVRKRLPAR